MDSRTADELFGSSEDNGLDFFAQSQCPSSPTQAIPQNSQPDVGQQQAHYQQEQQGYSNFIAREEEAQEVQHDPYSQLQLNSTVRTPSTARPATQRDPYALATNGYQPTSYTPAVPSSTPSTYSPPASQSSQYDPYAAAIPPKPATQQPATYSPYAPALPTPQQNYTPTPSYAPQVSPYAPPVQSALPKPPPPTNNDVSKYRSTPNAYDPPIRSTPVARAPVRYAPPAARNPYVNAPASAGYANAPPPPGPMNHAASPPRPPQTNANAAGFYSSPPPVRQTPPPPPQTMSPVHHTGISRPPYGAKPPTPQSKLGMQAAGHAPPPRAVSPYTYRAPVVGVGAGARATPPLPRPSSTTSNRSTGAYAQPPSAASVASAHGVHSRPASAASALSSGREGMISPPRRGSITAAMPMTMAEPLGPVEELDSHEYLRVPQEEDGFDMEGGDPTPMMTARDGLRSEYLDPEHGGGGPSERGIEDTYPPLEQDEIIENMQLDHESADRATPPPPPAIAAAADPYATIQRAPSLTYVPPMQAMPPPPPPSNAVEQMPGSPASVPKAIPPPPRANPYAPSSMTSPPQPPPPSGLTPSSSFRDAYAPSSSQSMSTLALTNINPVIDLSHSPPNTRHPISSYNPASRGMASRRNTAGDSDHGHAPQPQLYGAPTYGYNPAPALPPSGLTSAPETFGGAQYVAAATTSSLPTAYAPSPSLLGTNDPLGRASVRVPIFSFGFGGRVVACFHNDPALGGMGVGSTFEGVMAPAKPSTALTLKTLKDVIPPSAYDVTQAGFPGPLWNDQGAGGASSVLQSAGAAIKAKKTAVMTWLEAGIKEAEGGFMYAGAASRQEGGPAAAAKAEGNVVLMKLLKIWIEHDGKLSGSPLIEEAVRTALLGPASDSLTTLGGAPAPAFAYQSGGGMPFYPGESSQTGRESSTITYQVKASSLDRLQELLIRGERRQAYQFALDEKLWSHALLISSSLDKEAWKEVAHEFIKTELSLSTDPQASTGREALRLMYGLFAGDGPTSMKLLVPPTSFGVTGVQAHSRISSAGGPDSPTSDAAAVPDQTWMQWKKLLAATIANQPLGDTIATTALGDYLLSNNWVDAAHCCYLLAPTTSLFAGSSTPGVRAVLFGSASPSKFPTFHTSLQPVLLSEIAEYAKSLVPAAKGQESFQGIQHLQAYRLWHAACLAEMGEVVLAKRYTDAINATVRMSTRGSPYYTPTFMEQLEELHDRLVEAPHADKTKAWISKPSVRSLNEWITGGLEKLIQGDEALPKEDQPQGKKSLEVAPVVGPFSHYSAISSTTPSTHPSPSPSYANLHSVSSSIGRTESASGFRPPPSHSSTLPTPAPPRASSAMDYSRGRASPAPKVASAGAMTTSFRNPYSPSVTTAEPASTEQREEPPRPLYAQWWGDNNDDGVTPTATSFGRDGDEANEGSGNFISLMDSDPTLVPSVSTTSNGSTRQQTNFDDGDEDLGFGNSKKPKKEEEEMDSSSGNEAKKPNGGASTSASAQAAQPANVAQGDTASHPTKGWFSWIRRGDSTPKPVKASLGEESAFYYDANLKKWVNKKAGPEAATPKGPPAPPSRAQTASPGRAGMGSTMTPPPPRAASVIPPPPPSSSSLAPPPRPSSTLSSTSESPSSYYDSAPPSRGSPAPPMSGLPPRAGQTPPPSTGSPAGSVSGRAGAKKNARSRYVDVFQAP